MTEVVLVTCEHRQTPTGHRGPRGTWSSGCPTAREPSRTRLMSWVSRWKKPRGPDEHVECLIVVGRGVPVLCMQERRETRREKAAGSWGFPITSRIYIRVPDYGGQWVGAFGPAWAVSTDSHKGPGTHGAPVAQWLESPPALG